jgi:hypothetical protein
MRTTIATAILLSLFIAVVAAAPAVTTLTPFTVSAAMPEGRDQNQPQTNGTDLKIFNGRIVSLNGALFILRDDTNQVWYHLDDQTTARRFAGKDVNVKGKLDVATDVIHVQSIEEQKNSTARDR